MDVTKSRWMLGANKFIYSLFGAVFIEFFWVEWYYFSLVRVDL
ncbi:MAG: hypothetical protein G01um101420_385 [Parcubacteria group bacterium Gr01-1014_20]|nr:MAG: hypothetical protein G01um101420_385 [Parcubacteria group bacterium Gr01-1014_20]